MKKRKKENKKKKENKTINFLKKTLMTILSAFFLLIFLNLFYLMMIYIFPINISEIPADMQLTVNNIVKESSSNLEILQRSFGFVDNRYTSTRLAYLWWPEKLVERNLTEIWNDIGYQHCYSQTAVLKAMLLASGHFSSDDIKEFNLISYFPHQILKVKVDGEWINADPWGADHEIKLNEYYYPFILFSFFK